MRTQIVNARCDTRSLALAGFSILAVLAKATSLSGKLVCGSSAGPEVMSPRCTPAMVRHP